MKLLIPSPYLKKIIDNTAEFIIKHGRNFMTLIKKKYDKNKIFDFLEKNNIFYGYFIYRLNSILQKKITKVKSKENIPSRKKINLFNNVMKIKKLKTSNINKSSIYRKKLILSAHFINYNDLKIIRSLIKEFLINDNSKDFSFILKNLYVVQSIFFQIIKNIDDFLVSFLQIYFHMYNFII